MNKKQASEEGQTFQMIPTGAIESLKEQLDRIEKQIGNKTPGSGSNPENELLTSSEVCKLLKISYPTMMRLKKNGQLKFYSISGRLYCKKSEVMEAFNKGLL